MSAQEVLLSIIPIIRNNIPATEKISENLHIVGNEPSLAFYRIQEHVRKIVPVIVERQGDVAGLQQDLQGHAYDIEYSLR